MPVANGTSGTATPTHPRQSPPGQQPLLAAALAGGPQHQQQQLNAELQVGPVHLALNVSHVSAEQDIGAQEGPACRTGRCTCAQAAQQSLHRLNGLLHSGQLNPRVQG